MIKKAMLKNGLRKLVKKRAKLLQIIISCKMDIIQNLQYMN